MSHNDITGDRVASKPASESFREGFDRIFGKPAKHPAEPSCGGFDLERMAAALDAPSTLIPPDLSREEMRSFIISHAAESAYPCEPGKCTQPAERCTDWTKRGDK